MRRHEMASKIIVNFALAFSLVCLGFLALDLGNFLLVVSR